MKKWNIINVGFNSKHILQQPAHDNANQQQAQSTLLSISNNIQKSKKQKHKPIKKHKNHNYMPTSPVQATQNKVLEKQTAIFDFGHIGNICDNQLAQTQTTYLAEEKIKIQAQQKQPKITKIFKNKSGQVYYTLEGYSRNTLYLTRESILNDDKLYSYAIKFYQSKAEDFKKIVI